MTWDGQYFSTTFTAGEALNTEGHVGVAVVITTGLVAATGKTASGILLPHSKPKSGELGAAGYQGMLRFRAGLACSVGNLLTVTTSGYFIPVPTSGYYGVGGRVIEAAASGGLGVGMFDFSQPVYLASSY
jgi:hypothetical protein